MYKGVLGIRRPLGIGPATELDVSRVKGVYRFKKTSSDEVKITDAPDDEHVGKSLQDDRLEDGPSRGKLYAGEPSPGESKIAVENSAGQVVEKVITPSDECACFNLNIIRSCCFSFSCMLVICLLIGGLLWCPGCYTCDSCD